MGTYHNYWTYQPATLALLIITASIVTKANNAPELPSNCIAKTRTAEPIAQLSSCGFLMAKVPGKPRSVKNRNTRPAKIKIKTMEVSTISCNPIPAVFSVIRVRRNLKRTILFPSFTASYVLTLRIN